jgi:hypothetical protein
MKVLVVDDDPISRRLVEASPSGKSSRASMRAPTTT